MCEWVRGAPTVPGEYWLFKDGIAWVANARIGNTSGLWANGPEPGTWVMLQRSGVEWHQVIVPILPPPLAS